MPNLFEKRWSWETRARVVDHPIYGSVVYAAVELGGELIWVIVNLAGEIVSAFGDESEEYWRAEA